MQIAIAREIPETMRFDPHAVYTFARGPNAGRALKWLGPCDKPFDDMVRVVTADGQPFGANTGRSTGQREAVCKPGDLVLK